MDDKPTRCWCGEPCRGQVDTADDVPSHWCRQCGEHCELARYLHHEPSHYVHDARR